MVHHKLKSSLYLLAVLGAGCGGADHAAPAPSGNEAPSGGTGETSGGCKGVCPEPPAEEPPKGKQCSKRPRENAASSSPRSGSIGDRGPEHDGVVGEDGLASFVLDAAGRLPLVLRTLATNVTQRPNGFDLTGNVLVDVPGDEALVLQEARISLDRSPGSPGLDRLHGTVITPFPDTGILEGVHVSDPVVAEIGYDYGRNLPEDAAPLDDERKYLFFSYRAGFSAEVGELSISLAGGNGATIALDPSDHTIFARASFGGLLPVDEAGFGLSPGGHLAFTPENTWGIDAEAAAFEGHLWVNGKVNLSTLTGLPVVVGGNVVLDVDPDGDGCAEFQASLSGLQFGSNSELGLSIDAGFLGLEVPVTHATLVGRVNPDGARAYYSGVIGAGTDFWPEAVPLENTAELKVAGHVTSDLGESYLTAEGALVVDATELGQWTGLDLDRVTVARGDLRIDRDGVLLQGTASGRLSPILGFSRDVELEAFFNGNPDDWYVTFDGEIVVLGVNLSSDARAQLDRNGIAVSGTFRTRLAAVAMSGSITPAGVNIRGTQQVTIPVALAGARLGEFKGTANLRIGNAGLGGSVAGTYCTARGSCVPLAGGSVRVSDGRTEACVTVPVKGAVCAEI